MTMAKEIRDFVTKNMSDVGPFTTRDVADLSDNAWPSSNISVALNDWARCNWIVSGYRLLKDGKRGGTQRWELINASRTKPSERAKAEEDHGVFAGEVLDEREDGTLLVRTSGGDLYKVKKLEW